MGYVCVLSDPNEGWGSERHRVRRDEKKIISLVLPIHFYILQLYIHVAKDLQNPSRTYCFNKNSS